MGIRDKVINIAYRLRDEFTAKVGAVVGSIKKVDQATERLHKSTKHLAVGFKRLGGAVKTTAIAIAVTLVAAIAKAVAGTGRLREQLDQAAKSARALGESVQNLTALGYAAELSGLAVRGLHKGLQQMTRAVSEAADGTGEARDALGELGLEAARLEQMSPSEQLQQIAEAMRDIDNQSDRVRIAEKLFGARNAAGFLNLLAQGADGLRRMTQEAKDVGAVFDDAQAAKMERYNDNWTRLGNTLASVFNRARIGFADQFNKIVDGLGGQGLLVVARDLETVNREIHSLEESLRKAQAAQGSMMGLLIPDSFVSGMQERLRKLAAMRDSLIKDQKVRAAHREREAAERAHNRKMFQLYKEGVDGFKKALAERKQAYQASVAELQTLKAQEKSVAEEFAKFVQDVQAGKQGDVKPDFFDASLAKSEAEQALNAGNFDQALEKARAAKEMVQQLKDEGEGSSVALVGLAKAIERIANASAKGKVDSKQGEVDKQKQLIADIEERLKNLPKIKVTFDEEALQAEMDRIQKMLDERALTVQVKPSESVSGYGGQADIERILHRESLKRGDVR